MTIRTKHLYVFATFSFIQSLVVEFENNWFTHPFFNAARASIALFRQNSSPFLGMRQVVEREIVVSNFHGESQGNYRLDSILVSKNFPVWIVTFLKGLAELPALISSLS